MKKRKGIGVVEIVIIIAVFLVLGGLAWYASRPKANQSSASNEVSPSDTTTISATPDVEEEKYINIAQWGVRAKVPANTTLTYKIISSGKDEVAYFNSQELIKVGGICATDGQAGAIMRKQPGSKVDDFTDNIVDDSGAIRIGNYYYLYSLGNGMCSFDEPGKSLQQQARDAVLEVSKNLEPVTE